MVITCCHLTFSLVSRKGLVVIMLCILSDQLVEHFTAAGSVVNLCALDMSKVFDKVNHYALWIKLMNRVVPLTFLLTLMHCYSLFSAVVRWKNVLSVQYQLQCGVRQGDVLSPVLFAVYVNSLIESLWQSGYGCYWQFVCRMCNLC